MRIASCPAEIDADWLTEALREHGLLGRGRVASLSCEPVGAGMLGESARFVPVYEGEHHDVPRSFVGKFASPDPRSRQLGANNGLYLSEIQFYRELAPTSMARLPHAYVAEIDPETHAFTLLLEDLAPARPVDQIDGCAAADAERVIEQIAGVHAPYWNDASLMQRPWLARRTEHLKRMGTIYGQCIDIFEERFADLIAPEHIATCRRFAAHASAFIEHMPRNFTLKHTDLRLDNVLFDVRGTTDVAILDWQSIAIGAGTLDVAFFMGTSVEVEERRKHERDIVRAYLDALHRHGVRDYDWDACWADYRFQTYQGLCTSVVASSHTVRTPRSDAVFAAMARRAATMVEDLESLSLA